MGRDTLTDKIKADCVVGDDGYYTYWPKNHGALDAFTCRCIADVLDDLNEKWNNDVEDYFRKQQEIDTGYTEDDFNF